MFERLTPAGVQWADGTRADVDSPLWCTVFRPALTHLSRLSLRSVDGHVDTDGTRSVTDPRVHLVGYGDWTGPASATVIGVGRTARAAVQQITEQLFATTNRPMNQ
jgi:putative flavoprotein involved in K+ transport